MSKYFNPLRPDSPVYRRYFYSFNTVEPFDWCTDNARMTEGKFRIYGPNRCLKIIGIQ